VNWEIFTSVLAAGLVYEVLRSLGRRVHLKRRLYSLEWSGTKRETPISSVEVGDHMLFSGVVLEKPFRDGGFYSVRTDERGWFRTVGETVAIEREKTLLRARIARFLLRLLF
jgi:hypothetical protein